MRHQHISFPPHRSELPPNRSRRAKGSYHGVHGDTSEEVAKQNTQRSGLGEGSTNTQEQTGADGATESDELDVTRFQSSSAD